MLYYRPNQEFLNAIKNKELSEEEVLAYKIELTMKNKKYKKIVLWSFGILILVVLILLVIVGFGNSFANKILNGKEIILGVSLFVPLYIGVIYASKLVAYKEILKTIKNRYPKLPEISEE